MKQILIILSLLFTTSHAHILLINVFDNEDNTITVEGIYNTGDLATGAMVRFESLVTGEILFKQRLPIESELTIKVPTEPYQIVLDGGPGHILIKEGIAPLEGFSNESKDNKTKEKVSKINIRNTLSIAQNNTGEWNNTIIYLFSICLILFGLAIYFSFKNTNKILKEIKQSNQ